MAADDLSLGPDERAVRAVEAAYDAAWQAGNIEGLLACLTDDAVLVNPRNEMASGHAEIRRELGAFLEGEAKGSRHTSFIQRLAFVTADVAIVDGEAVVEAEQGETAVPFILLTALPMFWSSRRKGGKLFMFAHIRLQQGNEAGTQNAVQMCR